MVENKKFSSISKADSLEKMGEFWDNHDFTDFDGGGPDIEFEISTSVKVAPELLSALEKQALRRGITVETLVNLWLQEKINTLPSELSSPQPV